MSSPIGLLLRVLEEWRSEHAPHNPVSCNCYYCSVARDLRDYIMGFLDLEG